MKPDIVRRYAHNPILTKADIPAESILSAWGQDPNTALGAKP